MYKNAVLIFFIGLIILSCGDKDRPPKPANLIKKEKMADILYDLYIINAAKGVNRKIIEKQSLEPEAYVLTKHNIDSSQFADSNNYYAYDTEDYQSIIETVKVRLQKEKQEYEELQKREEEAKKRKRDSLRANNNPETKPGKS